MAREKEKFSLQSANRLTAERLRLFQSQEEAGTVCGVSRVMWGQYERAEAAPGGAVLEKLAAAGADVQYILTGIRGVPAMSAEQERAGYQVRVLSPDEIKALDALKAGGLLPVDSGESPNLVGTMRSGGPKEMPPRKSRSARKKLA